MAFVFLCLQLINVYAGKLTRTCPYIYLILWVEYFADRRQSQSIRIYRLVLSKIRKNNNPAQSSRCCSVSRSCHVTSRYPYPSFEPAIACTQVRE